MFLKAASNLSAGRFNAGQCKLQQLGITPICLPSPYLTSLHVIPRLLLKWSKLDGGKGLGTIEAIYVIFMCAIIVSFVEIMWLMGQSVQFWL